MNTQEIIQAQEDLAMILSDKRCQCDNCDWTGKESDTREISDHWERVEAGSEFPAGECPECHALAYIVEEENPYCAELLRLREEAKAWRETVVTLIQSLPQPKRSRLWAQLATIPNVWKTLSKADHAEVNRILES